MDFNVIPTDNFKNEAKRLIKKFPYLKKELAGLSETLAKAPKTGTPLGYGVYKIRLAIKSKGKGESGGARVITYVVSDNDEVYLLYTTNQNWTTSMTKPSNQLLKAYILINKASIDCINISGQETFYS